jgi:hypothetical protein
MFGWTCTFRARAGSQARATFSTFEQARHFAERHAGHEAGPFIWNDVGDASTLTTAGGTYNVSNTSAER